MMQRCRPARQLAIRDSAREASAPSTEQARNDGTRPPGSGCPLLAKIPPRHKPRNYSSRPGPRAQGSVEIYTVDLVTLTLTFV